MGGSGLSGPGRGVGVVPGPGLSETQVGQAFAVGDGLCSLVLEAQDAVGAASTTTGRTRYCQTAWVVPSIDRR